MKWFGNTSRVWQTALPGATTRTAAVFLAGQVHHAASPLRLFESGEWFLFAGSQTPLRVLSSSLTSVWMSAQLPQDESYKPFDLFPLCDHVCGCVWVGKTLSGFWSGANGEGCWVGGHFQGTPLCGLEGPPVISLSFHSTFTFCCTPIAQPCPNESGYPDDEGVRKRVFWPPSQFGKVTFLTSLWQYDVVQTMGIRYIEHPFWPHNAGGLCN